jgi:hypothetical protein
MKSLNITRNSIDKLYQRKKDAYCVYKKCKNYKLRNKNLCKPHEKKIVKQNKKNYIKILLTLISCVSIYFMYMYGSNFDFVYGSNFDFVYGSNFDFMYLSSFDSCYNTGFKHICENVQNLIEYIYNSNVTENIYHYQNSLCYILKDIEHKIFEYIN